MLPCHRRSLVRVATIEELVSTLGEEGTLFAVVPWTPESEAVVFTEDFSGTAGVVPGHEYLLECDLALEVVEVWSAQRNGRVPTSREAAEAVIHYAVNDAWLPEGPVGGVMTGFHVSSSRNRESILEHGLDWERMGAARGIAGSRSPEVSGVFVCRDADEADYFVRMNNTGGPVDLWGVKEVDRASLVDNGSGYDYVAEKIPAARLVLFRTNLGA